LAVNLSHIVIKNYKTFDSVDKMKADLKLEIEIPENVTVTVMGNEVNVKGPKGELNRRVFNPKIAVSVDDNKIVLSCNQATRREKKEINTYSKHINNMIIGVTEGFVYKLKICSGHFPMNVSLSNGKLVVKNYLGEKFPRTLVLKQGPEVKVEGDVIIVKGIDKDLCGQTAADIENLMRVTNRDRRIFQDGIYIIEKNGKKL